MLLSSSLPSAVILPTIAWNRRETKRIPKLGERARPLFVELSRSATILGLHISYRKDIQGEPVVLNAGYFFTSLRWKATSCPTDRDKWILSGICVPGQAAASSTLEG